MNRLWKIRPTTPEIATSLAREFSLLPPIAQLLAHRGICDSRAVHSFLKPSLSTLSDPFLLPDMAKAVDRVNKAIATQEKVIIFGDYDVDGMTSIALLLEIFGKMGAQCGFFLPSRFTDGYGFKMESLQRCIQDGAKLIVCVDCGTNSTEEIRYARTQGVDVIVLDHHEHNGVAFEAVAVVNHKRKDSVYKEELCSVGIAVKLAHALIKRAKLGVGQIPPICKGEKGGVEAAVASIDLKDVLDFVAIGTIADMVPLRGENRILVKAGLERLRETSHPGLKILRDLAGVKDAISATDVAFRIAPRLNANGRLSDAQDSLALLRTRSETEAMLLAQKLHQENQRRQQIERQASEEAIAMVHARRAYKDDPILVLYHPRWHVGVVGIVAAKITKEFGKPAVVIGLDGVLGKGSARSIEGFNIAEALDSAREHLLSGGGHAGAAGLTIEPDKIEPFRHAINEVAKRILSADAHVGALELDMDVPRDQLVSDLIEQLQSLEPFGIGNPRPMFATHAVHVDGLPIIVGGNHLKFQTRGKDTVFDVMGFRMGEKSGGHAGAAAMAGRRLDIAYQPCINIFNGQRRFQLNLEDFRFSS